MKQVLLRLISTRMHVNAALNPTATITTGLHKHQLVLREELRRLAPLARPPACPRPSPCFRTLPLAPTCIGLRVCILTLACLLIAPTLVHTLPRRVFLNLPLPTGRRLLLLLPFRFAGAVTLVLIARSAHPRPERLSACFSAAWSVLSSTSSSSTSASSAPESYSSGSSSSSRGGSAPVASRLDDGQGMYAASVDADAADGRWKNGGKTLRRSGRGSRGRVDDSAREPGTASASGEVARPRAHRVLGASERPASSPLPLSTSLSHSSLE